MWCVLNLSIIKSRLFFASIAWLFFCCTYETRAAPQSASTATERTHLVQVQADAKAAAERAKNLSAQADQLEADAEKATNGMVDVAAAIQAREDKLAGLDHKLESLQVEQKSGLEKLNSRRGDVVRLLAALQNLSRRPPQFILVRPGAAIDTARSATLLTAVLPELKKQTDSLKKDVAVMTAFRVKLETEKQTYQFELNALKTDRGTLNKLRQQREASRVALLAEAKEDQAKAQALATQAHDIKDLLDKLEQADRKRQRLARLPGPRLKPDLTRRSVAIAPSPVVPVTPKNGPPRATGSGPTVALLTPPKPMSGALGGLSLPVRGDVSQQFGASTATGPARGITIKTRPEAQVIAPYAGRVVFSGPFRAYGQLLIIAHGEGYHSLLAGMTRIDAKVGQILQTGEPIGVMGTTEDGAAASSLYVEIRRGGEPVNPLPWLSASLKRNQG